MGFSSILVAIAIAETLIVLVLAVYTLTLMIISIYLYIRYRKKGRKIKKMNSMMPKNLRSRDMVGMDVRTIKTEEQEV